MTTTEAEFAAVPAITEPAEPMVDIPGLVLAEAVRDTIWMAEHSTARSQQKAVGWSGIGDACPRKLSYQLTDTAISNRPDPLKAMVGTGGHLVMAEHYRRLDGGSGRYATEMPVSYRGVPGTVDLLDRRRAVLIDWKFKPLAKIRRLQREGVAQLSPGYVVQAHGYGAGLRAAGEQVSAVALCFVPTDATLADIHVWQAPLDVSVADKAVDRLAALKGFTPAQIPPRPGPLCPWCPFHRAGWTGPLDQGCPGTTALGQQPEGTA